MEEGNLSRVVNFRCLHDWGYCQKDGNRPGRPGKDELPRTASRSDSRLLHSFLGELSEVISDSGNLFSATSFLGVSYLIRAPDGIRKAIGHSSWSWATKVDQSRLSTDSVGSIFTPLSISWNRTAKLYA
jgi:hypothetical protein